jgi:hypothetical protein
VTAPTDWNDFRACTQVCRQPTGQPCVARSGKVVDGQPDGAVTVLSVPHVARKRRVSRLWPLTERGAALEGRPHPIR